MITALQVIAADVGAPKVLVPRPAIPPIATAPLPPINDVGEPLVELDDDFLCLNLYRVDGWEGTRPASYVRASVRERLLFAQRLLPDGFSLAVFDGWRSMATVRALYAHFYGPGSTLPPGFLADPNDPETKPPHSTGAAVDLTLAWQGQALALGTYFDDFSPRAESSSLEFGDEAVEPDCSLRRLLYSVMAAADFVGLADEWWHYSFGDQEWAWQKHQSTAMFDSCMPR